LRNDFRTFRLDRVTHLQQLGRIFEQRRGKRLSDYLKRVRAKFLHSRCAPWCRRNRYCVFSAHKRQIDLHLLRQ
jgi:predicted DNA-binding transcriptional regulator YafY